MKDWKRKKTNSGTRKEYQNGIYQTCIVQWMRYRIYIVYYIVPYNLYEYNIYVERFFLLYIYTTDGPTPPSSLEGLLMQILGLVERKKISRMKKKLV